MQTLLLNLPQILITLVLGFVTTGLIMPLFIPYLHKLKFGQHIRVDGPQSHLAKGGTPTMGGIVFVLGTILTVLLANYHALFSTYGAAISLIFIGFALIGFLDDYIIVVKKDNTGLKPLQKLLAQIFLTAVFFIAFDNIFNLFGAGSDMTAISIPFMNDPLQLGMLFIPFAFVLFVGYSNAVNLTDGLDGLSSGTMVIALVPFALYAYQTGNVEIATFIVALIGNLLGFLLYNKKPAKIFMGDTGSLALGGFFAVIALLLKVEIISLIIGIIFISETLSVVLQVGSFKLRKKRIFKMAPIHHHFELSGLKETQVVYLFYGVGLVGAIIGYILMVM